MKFLKDNLEKQAFFTKNFFGQNILTTIEDIGILKRLKHRAKWTTGKGQLISECPYEIIVSPKIPTKKFPRFLP